MRDVRAIVTQRGAGCDRTPASSGDLHRTKRSQRTAKSCGPGAATLASILSARAGTATVTIKAAHRGEHEASRQTIARGKPGCLGCTCSFYPVCESTRDVYGCIQRPAFPAASVKRRDNEDAKLGRYSAARMRALARNKFTVVPDKRAERARSGTHNHRTFFCDGWSSTSF